VGGKKDNKYYYRYNTNICQKVEKTEEWIKFMKIVGIIFENL